MKIFRPTSASALAAIWFLSAVLARGADVSPAQQVINMLTDMVTKGQKSKQAEALTFQRYAEWADDQSKDLTLALRDVASKIEGHTAFISKAQSDVNSLARAIAAQENEIAGWGAEVKQATKDRQNRHDEYVKESEDYAESVDALQRAIQVLSQQDFDRDQAEMLLQKMAEEGPIGISRVVSALLQKEGHSSLRGEGAPAVAAYEFRSGKVVEVLKDLLDKFREELADVEKGEASDRHAFELSTLHLSNLISTAEKERDEKAILRGQRSQESANVEGQLSTSKSDQAADTKLKAEIEATLRVKKSAFEENQGVRAAELEAVKKAIEILSSPQVQASYSKHLTLAQANRNRVNQGGGSTAPAASFLQLKRSKRTVSRHTSDKAYTLLSQKAKDLQSKALEEVASALAANPFAKVVGMIEGLLETLRSEAASEAEHSAWCAQETKANKEKRDAKSSEADKLSAEIEGKAAAIGDMLASIGTLSKEQADLAKAMTEAASLRISEKATNEETIREAGEGSEAVKQALVILKEFYASQNEASDSASAALLQNHEQREKVPEFAAYKGMQGNTGGVIGMLEVIESDFLRLKSETESSEFAASQEYDRFMKESTVAQQNKHEAEVQLKLQEDQAQFEKGQLQKDLLSVKEELANANQYYAELKHSCLQVHVSYEERVQKREEEINALKEAYKILDSKASSEA